MFYQCDLLEHIKFGTASTPTSINMEKIVQKCRKIKNIDFTPLGRSKVEKLDWIFEGCYSLETINFGSLDTSLVDNLNGFFCECYSLVVMEMNFFDTSHVTTMEYMFKDCINIKSINLELFDTRKVQSMDHMFYNCSSLVFLNLRHFLKDSLNNINEIFGSLAEGVKYCLEDIPTRQVIFYQGGISVCDDSCFTISKPKIDMSNKQCLNSCSESTNNNKFEYFNACYDKCPKGTKLDGFQCSNNECEGKPNSAICKDETPIGYYLDPADEIYKKCYEKCKYCYGEGNDANNKCIECKSDYKLIKNPLDIENCYANCQYYYYFDKSNNYHCTISNQCPPEYRKLIEEKGQCEYEEIITTQVQKETTIITTFAIQETTSEISKMTTQIDTTSIASTVVTSIADSSAIVTSIADDRNGISSIVDSSADISSTNLGSTAISSIADSSIAFTTSSIYSTDMGRIDISTAILNEIDTTYKTKYSVSSSELDIRTSNMESNVNIVTFTFYSERYGCLSNPLTLRCSMTQTSNNTQIYNLVVTNILSNYKGDNLKSIVFEGEDDTIFQVTSAKNELDLLMNGNLSENYNISIIDFSECEKILKEHYHIAEEDSLIFIKQEKITDKESDKNIQYECYEPYNFTKLNLSLCSRVSINIYVPLSLSEETKKMAEEMDKLGYNIFNLNDRFYKDMCTRRNLKLVPILYFLIELIIFIII